MTTIKLKSLKISDMCKTEGAKQAKNKEERCKVCKYYSEHLIPPQVVYHRCALDGEIVSKNWVCCDFQKK